MGASAGGLEAFEQFFHALPADSGCGFVLVQHLDPHHASLLTEILQRATQMPVIEAQDQVEVEPNHVYIIPPNRDMAIVQGKLQLSVPEEPRGLRMPIDVFLRSLAEDRGAYAVGIILSGTGTDGTLGMRAILGGGGVALVQEPAGAKYEGMPTSVIRAGYVTQVLPADQMASALLANGHASPVHQPASAGRVADTARTESILMAVRNGTGHDFSQYKKSTIGRRIERRMALHNIDDMALYARYLAKHPSEVQALFKEMLINVTSFFRDPEVFRILRQEILPALCADQPKSQVFRVWVVGCSTGEEAFSLAIVLREFMDETGIDCKVQIYATDLDDDAIKTARMGQYPPNIAQDVTPERLQRYFSKVDSGYRVKKDIREMVVFAVHSLIKDPPFTRLDLVSCRNLMIYLEPELQSRLVPALHYALRPDGVLLLSPSEGIGHHTGLFEQVNRKWKLYRAVYSAAPSRALMTSGLSWTHDTRSHPPADVRQKADSLNIAELTKRVLLQAYAPASVVTDLNGNILYVYGETGAYLSPAPGLASLNVLEMTRDGLQLGLRAAMNSAIGQKLATLDCEVPHGGESPTVSLSVRPISDPAATEGLLLVSFQQLAAIPETRSARGKRTGRAETARLEALERDLAYTRQNLQATIEEQQATNEELKSANEEMQSSNEEMQSVNEELETSKEEMQSVNEELVTVNAELQSKIEQLSDMQNDMKNLLENIHIGTLFLDERLNIRRFTREAMHAYRLSDADIGRPLADIKSDLVGGDLLRETQAVLDTLIAYEGQVATLDGAIFLARIQPYRTLDNVIAGVVLTFTDLSQRVASVARELAQAIVDTVSEPLLVLDGAFTVISASRSFYRFFEVTAEATVGHSLFELGNRQWDIPALREQLETVLPHNQSFEDFAVRHSFPQIGQCTVVLNARRLQTPSGATPLILLAMEIPERPTPGASGSRDDVEAGQ